MGAADVFLGYKGRMGKTAVIVGGGIVGLASALRLCEAGYTAKIIDDGAEWRSTDAAAGIVFPDSADSIEGDVGRADLKAVGLFPEWLESFEGKEEALFRQKGLLRLASGPKDEEEIKQVASWLEANDIYCQLGDPADFPGVDLIDPAALKSFPLALFVPGASSVDPRALRGVLEKRLREKRMPLYKDRALEIVFRDGRANRIRCKKREVGGHFFVGASGALGWEWLPEEVRPELSPMAGEGLLIECEGFDEAPTFIFPDEGVLVPRGDGRAWLGTTLRPWEQSVESPYQDIMTKAAAVFPSLASARTEKELYGVRPTSQDGIPLVGPTHLARVFLATGSGRHGILQAPLVANAICQWVSEEESSEEFPSFDPRRV